VGFVVTRSSGSSSAATTSQTADPNGSTPSGGARPGARGTVTKLDGSDITVQTTDQSGATSTSVVRTSDDTTYTKSVSGSVSDLQAGDNVVVTGDSSNGSIVATSINDMGDMNVGRGADGNNGQPPADFSGAPANNGDSSNGNGGSFPTPPSGAQGQGGNFTIGQITAVDGSTIMLSSASGDTVTVTTNGSTTFTVMKSASLADIKVGDTITATGDSSNGVVTATAIRIGDTGFGPGGLGGGSGFDPNASSQSGN
jgi:Cu/Ag efflux protein CusF